MSKNLAEIPMPDLMDKDPRSAPPTVAVPKTINQNGCPTDAVGTATTLERPSSRDLLEPVTTSRSATGESVVEAKSGAPLPVLARTASSPRSVSDALALLEASPAPAKTESVATSLPASIDVDASLPQAFTVRPVPEQIQMLDRLANQISPVTGASIRALFRHPPTIIGQSVAEYFELVNAALDDLIPHGFREALLVKQIVDEEWKVLTFSLAQRSLLNAAIAAGLVDRLSESGGEAESQSSEERKSHSRQWRQVVFAAASGNEAMRSLVEKHAGTLGFDAFAAKQLMDDIRAHIFADNVVSNALKRLNSAMRQFEQMREARHKNPGMRAKELKTISEGNQWLKYLKPHVDREATSTNTNAKRSTTEPASGKESGR
jgi:hypothetical protein